jgi:folate-binding protein YgfZ
MMMALNALGDLEDAEGKYPHSVNLDLYNSLDLNKGCFLGQEMTARNEYQGVVRKRPFFMVIVSKN